MTSNLKKHTNYISDEGFDVSSYYSLTYLCYVDSNKIWCSCISIKREIEQETIEVCNHSPALKYHPL